MFRQARWQEPLLIERDGEGKIGISLPSLTEEEQEALHRAELHLPKELRREELSLPSLSEHEVVRHFTRLSQQSFGVDLGLYPLGSCTMKYNPKLNDALAAHPKLKGLHPYQDEGSVQGLLGLLFELELLLREITGMHRFSLQPPAGSSGEYCGASMMRAYYRAKREERDEMIVPDSAHGSNFASASLAGFTVKVVPSDEQGCVDIEALKSAVGPRTAGLMLTNPNTLGIFERRIKEIAAIVHEAGGLLYYDGANLNSLLGIARPGDMGFDIVHLNLHKTFSTPHGGGGPGAGPIGVKAELEPFLPVPLIAYDGSRYYLDYNRPQSIGRARAFYGQIPVLLRAYAYILSLGAEGLRSIARLSVLHSNYLLAKLLRSGLFELPFASSKRRMHEFVISPSRTLRQRGVRAWDIAKRLLDYGHHAPTVYFPQIVEEAMMVEPTESATKEELDAFAEAMISSCRERASLLKRAPYHTTVRRVDEVRASHPLTLCITWKQLRKGEKAPSVEG
jgi:glycine dehydrogenase subunit 2